MACCAFVAFLLGQIYLALRALTRWMRGTRDAPQKPSAATWRLYPAGAGAHPAPLPPPHQPQISRLKDRRLGLVSLAVVAELVIMIGGVQAFRAAGLQTLMSDAQQLVRAKSVAELRLICSARR